MIRKFQNKVRDNVSVIKNYKKREGKETVFG